MDAAAAEAYRKREIGDRVYPNPSEVMREAMAKPPIYIHNTFPLPWTRTMGGLGRFYIQACPHNGFPNDPSKWARHGKPLAVQNVVIEYADGGNGEMKLVDHAGLTIARDVVYGDPAEDLRRWGVFVSANAVPTEAELATALEYVTATMNEILQEADILADGTATQRASINIRHRQAASFLNQARIWNTKNVRMENCPRCRQPIYPGTVQCSQCKAVLDEAAFLANDPEMIRARALASLDKSKKPAKPGE